MSNINAAIGSTQLRRLSEFKTIKTKLSSRYITLLSDISYVKTFPFYQDNIIPHVFVVLLDKCIDRTRLRDHFTANNIQTGIHYPPNHMLTKFKSDYRLPNTESLFPRLLSLPFHCDMSLEDVDTVISVLCEFL